MADGAFEHALERMFAEAPAMADADVFALRIRHRLDRGWTARRLLIGVMGAAGGLIGAYELLGSGAVGEMAQLGARSHAFLEQHIGHALAAALAPVGLPADGQALLMTGGLALVALALGLARLIRET
ncbi:MAG: hypothetical protein ACREEW_11470 [Caulobacteraceae bacterium]